MAKKIKLSMILTTVVFAFDIEEQEHEFEFREFTSKQTEAIGLSGEKLLEIMKQNTKCITPSISKEQQQKVLDKLYDKVWNEYNIWDWSGKLQKLVGNEKNKS